MWKRPNRNSEPLMPEEAYQKAAAYCAYSEHCPQEVRDKLVQWGQDSRQQQDELIDRLTDEGFLSEERYCRAFVNDKIRFSGWGREKVRQALAAKRLPQQAIAEALEAFPQDEYQERLSRIAAKKAAQLKGEPQPAFEQKLLRFLVSRGFTFSEIRQAITRLPSDE